ncbi:cytochrome P450 [Nocardiopsis composta]
MAGGPARRRPGRAVPPRGQLRRPPPRLPRPRRGRAGGRRRPAPVHPDGSARPHPRPPHAGRRVHRQAGARDAAGHRGDLRRAGRPPPHPDAPGRPGRRVRQPGLHHRHLPAARRPRGGPGLLPPDHLRLRQPHQHRAGGQRSARRPVRPDRPAHRREVRRPRGRPDQPPGHRPAGPRGDHPPLPALPDRHHPQRRARDLPQHDPAGGPGAAAPPRPAGPPARGPLAVAGRRRRTAALPVGGRRHHPAGGHRRHPLDGGAIPAGEGYIALLGAANHDPAAFPDPQKLDVARPQRNHVAFGYGAHQCVGQNLGRLEIEVALRTLFDRAPGLRPAVPLEELPLRSSSAIFGLEEVPVTW